MTEKSSRLILKERLNNVRNSVSKEQALKKTVMN